MYNYKPIAYNLDEKSLLVFLKINRFTLQISRESNKGTSKNLELTLEPHLLNRVNCNSIAIPSIS